MGTSQIIKECNTVFIPIAGVYRGIDEIHRKWPNEKLLNTRKRNLSRGAGRVDFRQNKSDHSFGKYKE